MSLALLGAALCPHLAAAQTAAEEMPTRAQSKPARLVWIQCDSPPELPLLAEGLTRLVAELGVAGFEVKLLGRGESGLAEGWQEPEPDDEREGVEPYALLHLSVAGDQLRLEISSHAARTSSHLSIVGKKREVAALCLQAAEFLRAGLVPNLSAPNAPSAPSAPPSTPPEPLERPPSAADEPRSSPRSGSFRLDLGAALLSNWGARDSLSLLALRSGYAFTSGFALAAAVYVPLNDARFVASHGFADYRLWLGAVEANYAWLEWPQGELSLGFDAGLARSSSVGTPDAPWQAEQAAAWSLLLGAGLGAEYRVSDAFALAADAHVLSLSPSPVVAIVADERRLGGPAVRFGLGARFSQR